MSTKSLLMKTGVIASPLKTPSSPRGILKRPPPLPLSQTPTQTTQTAAQTPTQTPTKSPFPFAATATLTVLISPTLAIKSPHVHFPPSAKLTSLFSTHSPGSYDRGAINVSPNPLELPAWGARVYSPSLGGFDVRSPRLGLRTPTSMDSDLNSDSDVGLGSPAAAASANAGADVPAQPNSPGSWGVSLFDMKPPTTRAGFRFQALASQPSIRPVSDLGKSLRSYPRSPYPSAPTSPLVRVGVDGFHDKEKGTGKENVVGRPLRAKTVHGDNPARVSRMKKKVAPPPPLAVREGDGHDDGMMMKQQQHVSSPYPREFLSPLIESPQRTITPEFEVSLTQAFWQSMSMSLDASEGRAYGVTSPGLPNMPVPVSPVIFGNDEGVLTVLDERCGTPRLGDLNGNRDFNRVSGSMGQGLGQRSMLMSPSPSDPFSAFPSFAAVLSLEGEGQGSCGAEHDTIRYPPRAVISE